MSWKSRYRLPEGPYFLSHSVGLPPVFEDSVLETKVLAPWRAGRGDVWDSWLEALDAFRMRLAQLINARPREICPQTNVSSALSKILFSLPLEEKRRRRILLTRADFPTVGHVLGQAARFGCTLDFLEAGPDLADPATWKARIDSDVLLVHITHIYSNLGVKTPAAAIAAAARAAGATAIVDAAQSAGAVPLDAASLGADYITGTSVKYLCGGPGAAWLWASDAACARAAPLDVGWFSAAEPFSSGLEDFQYADGASRFLGGTPSIAPFALAADGISALLEAGPAAVARHNQAMLDRLLSAMPREACISHARPGERGAAVILQPSDVEAAARRLHADGIGFDRRMGGLRISMHLYNDADDVDRLAEALRPFV